MKVGVIGGGQLGRMLALAGVPLGMQFVFLDPNPEACAVSLGKHLCADFSDRTQLEHLARSVDVVTFEFESVPAETVAFLEQLVPVYPGAEALRIAQDRWLEKSLFQELEIPTASFANIEHPKDLDLALVSTGLPAILKTRTLGYDGKGQVVVRHKEQLAQAWNQLGRVPCILEAMVPFTAEASLLAVRDRMGALCFYPLVQNIHQNGVLRLSMPSTDHPLQAMAEAYAQVLLEHFDYVGVLGFEFFEVEGILKANEIAPRVHNSGHWTIEGAHCSQFENHLRAISGLPLGDVRTVGESAMLNFLGSIPPVARILSIEDAHVHHYGKAFRAGRKVGHVTVRSSTRDILDRQVMALESLIDQHALRK